MNTRDWAGLTAGGNRQESVARGADRALRWLRRYFRPVVRYQGVISRTAKASSMTGPPQYISSAPTCRSSKGPDPAVGRGRADTC
jgi:hypothetical protein